MRSSKTNERWNRNEVSRALPDAALKRRPPSRYSRIKSKPEEFNDPNISNGIE